MDHLQCVLRALRSVNIRARGLLDLKKTFDMNFEKDPEGRTRRPAKLLNGCSGPEKLTYHLERQIGSLSRHSGSKPQTISDRVRRLLRFMACGLTVVGPRRP